MAHTKALMALGRVYCNEQRYVSTDTKNHAQSRDQNDAESCRW